MTIDDSLTRASAMALQVLDAGIDGGWKEAVRILGDLSRLAPDGEVDLIGNAAIIWIDALRDHLMDGQFRELRLQLIGPVALADQSGKVFVYGSAEADMEVEAKFLWAAQLVDARLNMNFDRFVGLWRAAPDEDYAQYVGAVLNTVVSTIQNSERGCALQNAEWLYGPADGE